MDKKSIKGELVMEWFLWFTLPLSIILLGFSCFMTYKVFKALENWLDEKIESDKAIKEKN